MRLTLANGADLDSFNRYGGTALIPAAHHGHVDTVRLLLTTATENMTRAQRARCPAAGNLCVGETDFTEVPEPEPFRMAWLGSR